jgi:hypothetical protein
MSNLNCQRTENLPIPHYVQTTERRQQRKFDTVHVVQLDVNVCKFVIDFSELSE